MGGIPDMVITCCTSLGRDVCPGITAMNESVIMAGFMMHRCDGCEGGGLDL